MPTSPPQDVWASHRAVLERFLLDETGEVTMLVDMDAMTILAARGPVERILGWEAEAWAGTPLSTLRPAANSTARGMRFGPAVLSEPGFFGEVLIAHAEGERVVSMRVQPFTTPDGGQRVLVRVIDAAEAVELSLDLQRAHTALQEAFTDLARHEQALAESRRTASLSHFAAALSHELNNPIGPIRSGLYVLTERLRDPCSEEARLEMNEVIAEIDSALERLASIGSRLSELETPTRSKRFDLAAELRQIAPTEELHAEPLEMESDPSALRRLVSKLLTNARQAVGPDGRVVVVAEPDGDAVRVTISDEGPGVDPAVRDRIFDPFFTTRPPGAGLGLGLFLARRIANTLGGDLSLVDSAKGARFLARLPKKMPVGPQATPTNYEQLRVYGKG